MKPIRKSRSIGFGICATALGLLLTGCGTSGRSPTGSYQITEHSLLKLDPSKADHGPVRLARVAFMKGPVTWRPNASADWRQASMNLPFRQGAQVWVKDGSRCELQFDDGSALRLGGGAVATLQNLYSDDHGEFTEIKMNGGLGTLNCRSKLSEYQLDTPYSSVKAVGPAELRVGVGKTVEVACLSGEAHVDGPQGNTILHSNHKLEAVDDSTPYEVASLPPEDDWDRFNSGRDVIVEHHNEYLPPNIDLVADNLDDYGTWHDDPHYGHVWAPRVHESNWRPYHHGRWEWVSPWGWTWVADEDWGWAPYHYGTWVEEPYGWAWCPGPATQYWSPAVVDFVDDDPYVGWAPLSPAEVRYPSVLDIGFRSGNWAFNFAIGQVGAYYPAGPSYCVGRPWANEFVNREVNVYNQTTINNYYQNAAFAGDPAFVRGSRFMPVNALRSPGMTLASREGFLRGAGFQAPGADPRGTVFRRGRSFDGAPRQAWQISGPLRERPQAASFAAMRTFNPNRPPSGLLGRQVFHGQLPRAVAMRPHPTNRIFGTVNGRDRGGLNRSATRVPNFGRPQPGLTSGAIRSRQALRRAAVGTVPLRHPGMTLNRPGRPNLGHGPQMNVPTRAIQHAAPHRGVPAQPKIERRSFQRPAPVRRIPAQPRIERRSSQRPAPARRIPAQPRIERRSFQRPAPARLIPAQPRIERRPIQHQSGPQRVFVPRDRPVRQAPPRPFVPRQAPPGRPAGRPAGPPPQRGGPPGKDDRRRHGG